jgi:hypothetical protein
MRVSNPEERLLKSSYLSVSAYETTAEQIFLKSVIEEL